jgi:hypothetical protein
MLEVNRQRSLSGAKSLRGIGTMLCVVVGAWALVAPWRALAESSPIQLVLTEVSLGQFVQQRFPSNPAGLFASADGRHVQFFVKQGGKTVVYVDGVAGAQYDSVQAQSLCSLGGQFAFLAHRSRQTLAVFGSHEGKLYNKIGGSGGRSLFVSPDGRHLAYEAVENRKHMIVLDGKEGEPYDQILRGTPIFSDDSKRLAYAAKRDGKFVVVLDTNEIAEADDVATIRATGKSCGMCFSPDSRHFAYTVKRSGSWFVVQDGVESKPYASYGMEMSIFFSPDGRRLAYEFGGSGPALLVVDGKTNWLATGGDYAFSPDSKHFAYVLGNKPGATPRATVVLDGATEYPGGSSVDQLLFSPDSQKLVYTAHFGTNEELVAINGQGDRKYTDIGPEMTFSSDGQHFVYFAREESSDHKESKFFMVMDGHVTPLGAGPPKGFTFSPDGQHWAVACLGGKPGLRVLVDGKTIGTYYDIEMPSNYSPDDALVFSPDSRHVAFRSTGQDGASRVVVDGVEQKISGRFLFHTTLVFDSPTHLHGLGLRGDQVFRFELEVVAKAN